MRQAIFALLLASMALGPAHVARGNDPQAAAGANLAPAGTGKERLSDKGSDEQRVNDCKVPAGRRTRERPVSCPADTGH
jgi:hypothetical protein